MIRNFNADGFGSLYPKYRGGRAPKFTLGQRREIKKIAKSRPVDHGLPFSTWSLAKLADFLVAAGMVDDISHEGSSSVLPIAFFSASRAAWSCPACAARVFTSLPRRVSDSGAGQPAARSSCD